MLYLFFKDEDSTAVYNCVTRTDDETKDYSSPDVPRGRDSVIWCAINCMNQMLPEKMRVWLPDWTDAEKTAIHTTCRNLVIEENPYEPREITEEEVLDRFYKHDPETGERTDEPTGEFETLEECRAALEQEDHDQWEEMIKEKTEVKYKQYMDNCIIAPLAMAGYEERPDIKQLFDSKRLRLIELAYLNSFPKTDTELDHLLNKYGDGRNPSMKVVNQE